MDTLNVKEIALFWNNYFKLIYCDAHKAILNEPMIGSNGYICEKRTLEKLDARSYAIPFNHHSIEDLVYFIKLKQWINLFVHIFPQFKSKVYVPGTTHLGNVNQVKKCLQMNTNSIVRYDHFSSKLLKAVDLSHFLSSQNFNSQKHLMDNLDNISDILNSLICFGTIRLIKYVQFKHPEITRLLEEQHFDVLKMCCCSTDKVFRYVTSCFKDTMHIMGKDYTPHRNSTSKCKHVVRKLIKNAKIKDTTILTLMESVPDFVYSDHLACIFGEACRTERFHLMSVLLDKDLPLTSTSCSRLTAIEHICSTDNHSLILKLIDKNVSLNEDNGYVPSALHLLVKPSTLDIVIRLIDAGKI